jgi:radical SAM superfamily enzyme YgiQ (UPF0313 family)
VGLVEAARGCTFTCDFCSIQSAFNHSQSRRPLDEVVEEVKRVWPHVKLIFFIDDNLSADMPAAKEFVRALIPLKIRWVGQAAINAAHDEEFLGLLAKSGCQGLLIGFESLNPASLKSMNKGFNTMKGGYEPALANLRRYGLRLYATFVFGYDTDTPATFAQTMAFAQRHNFYIAAFAHLLPFPGTPLYQRLQEQNRLLYPQWWLDDAYSYNLIPYTPAQMTPQELQRHCLEARQRFYAWPNILRRSLDPLNRPDWLMFSNFFIINGMLRAETRQRNFYPLGDMSWRGALLQAQ